MIAKERVKNFSTREGGPGMATVTQPPTLEARVKLWKARAQAKQARLRHKLFEPVENPRRALKRMALAKLMLQRVQRRQVGVNRRATFLDIYAEHLRGLDKTLSSAIKKAAEHGEGTTTPGLGFRARSQSRRPG